MASTPAVRFLIKNYKDATSGNVITTEKEMMTIPLTDDPVITEPKVKCEMGKAGSFEFGVELNSPYYDAFMQMKTLLRVELFGQTIFRGRVLTIDKKLTRSRAIHCEGDFAFLLDTIQMGTKEDSRSEIGVLEYLTQIINQHNSSIMSDTEKKFTLGEVPGRYTSATASEQQITIPSDKAKQKFGDTSNNTSMDRIEGLLSDFGGYFRTRYDASANKTYLDWYDRYYNATANTQTIEVAKNLIDLSGPTEVENLFTVVIPIGKKDSENIYITDYWPVKVSGHAKVNYMTVPELATIPLYSNSELNSGYHRKTDYTNAITRYGVIWKTVDFENANTPEKLFSYCKDWILQNYMPELTQWDVSALDLRFVDGNEQPLYCGDRVSLKHPEVDQTFGTYSVIAATYDLFNPEKNKYTIGIPNQQINAAYGVKEKTNTSSTKSSGSKKASSGPKKQDDDDDLTDEQKDTLQKLTHQYILKSEYGEDIGLDDPVAYRYYNTDGSAKTAEQTRAAVQEDSAILMKYIQDHGISVPDWIAEAKTQGLNWTDPKFLRQKIPTYMAKENQFRNQTEAYLHDTLHMDYQTSQVLLNDSSSTSWLANLVDDDGNWASDGLPDGYEQTPELRMMAINARKILSGNSNDPETAYKYMQSGGGVLNTINSLSERIGNFFNVDGLNLQFDIGNLISDDGSNLFGDILTIMGSADGVGNTFSWLQGMFTGGNNGQAGNTFSLLTDSINVDGEDGGIGCGKDPNSSSSGDAKWLAAINKKLTYKDENGNVHTLPEGAINAADYSELKAASGKPIPSFSTKFAAIEQAVILKASIVDLQAANANISTLQTKVGNIESLTSKMITTDNLSSKIGALQSLYAKNIQCSGQVSCSSLLVDNLSAPWVVSKKFVTGVNFTNQTVTTKDITFLGYIY